MNILVIDGNSLINRAFFGIKLLTAKDGHYTNAIFGFMNMFLNLLDRTKAEAVAVAFDLKAPTFRHKLYDAYKAGRRPMPQELFEQMEPIKKILKAFGCHIVECEGYEADDILGTLSYYTPAEDFCFLATGDRDALQLVRDNVTVLLPSTKMGQTVTEEYTPALIREKYGVTPAQMIEIKALQGDSSDNIPGVPGIGPKTAGMLVQTYGSVDGVYADIDALAVTNGVREKLRAGKDSAYLSRTLGTISHEAPISKDISAYILAERDDVSLKTELVRHELFKLLSKLELNTVSTSESTPDKSESVYEPRIVTIHDEKEFSFTSDDCVVYLHAPDFHGILSELSFFANEILYTFQGPFDGALALYERILCHPVCTDDAKALFRFSLDNGLPQPNVTFDLRLAAYLLNPNASSYGIPEMAMDYHVPIPSSDLPDPVRELCSFPLLEKRMTAVLLEREQTELLAGIEIPLARVLAEMERSGMAVDCDSIRRYADVLAEKTQALEQEIYDLAGEAFNINSPKQLGVILFEKLGLPARKKTKTGYSTNADVLEELADKYPIVSLVLEYRTYAKLKSTYCDGLLKAVSDDGRIHSTFNQTETRTGRLSSTEPNLQNIPVRTEIGREFRKFFVAGPGKVLVDADYSQIELRVLAALSGDPMMLDCFNTGVDIHTATASKVFGIPESEVTPEMRSRAKAVNFGIVYGIGAFSLAKDIHVSRAEADAFIKAYLSLYGAVDGYMRSSIQLAKEKGFAETLYHRRRYLPELTSSNAMLRAFGERVARNMPIQGTAADVIKIAMIRVSDRLRKEMPAAKLIMQVHDELILETPADLGEKAASILKEEMENAVSLSVKLDVDAGVGLTWYEAKG